MHYHIIYSDLSFCENLTIDFVKKHIDKPWDWENLSYNDDFSTPEIVEANPEMPWDWTGLTDNINFTMEYIDSHLDFPWNWDQVVRKENMTAKTTHFTIKSRQRPTQLGTALNAVGN